MPASVLARRAGEALEQATVTALDALETPPPAPGPPAPGTPAPGGDGLFDALSPADALSPFDALSPEEFEEAIAALCARDGCSQVEVVGGAGDLGADVVALAPMAAAWSSSASATATTTRSARRTCSASAAPATPSTRRTSRSS